VGSLVRLYAYSQWPDPAEPHDKSITDFMSLEADIWQRHRMLMRLAVMRMSYYIMILGFSIANFSIWKAVTHR
jgi:hypothetical protein